MADGEPHDGGLVELCAGVVRQGELVGQLVEDLRLLAAAGAGRIAGLLLPLLRIPATRITSIDNLLSQYPTAND